MPEDQFVLLLGQQRMSDLLLKELQRYDSVQVRFAHEFVGCEQNETLFKVMVVPRQQEKGDDVFFSADWVVATDGANSTVRRSLCIPFDGYTHTDFRMIGADVLHNFGSKDNYSTVMNFIVHPHDWAVVIYTGENEGLRADGLPLCRVAYGEANDLPDDPATILERAKKRVAKYHKSFEGDFDVRRAEPYRLQQRCAGLAIKGRVVLAGDVLHSNNPIGGLGLTTGILDAFTIGNALVRVCANGEPESLVTEAADDRRTAWLNATNPMSVQHLQRLRSVDHDYALERQQYFHRLKNDPEFLKQMRMAVERTKGKDFAIPSDVSSPKP